MDALLLTFLVSGLLSLMIGNVNASLEEEIVKQLAGLTNRVEQLELKVGLSLRREKGETGGTGRSDKLLKRVARSAAVTQYDLEIVKRQLNSNLGIMKHGLKNQKKTTAAVVTLCKGGLSRLNGTVTRLRDQMNDNFSKLNNSLTAVDKTVATVNITCNKCRTGGLLPGMALTSSSVKSCGDPGIPNNGRKDLHRHSIGSTFRYSCNEGYELVGEMDTVCLVSAQWSNPQPACREVKCPSLNNRANGRIVGTVRTSGSSVTLKCNEGYLSTGPSTALCQQNKTWTNQPFRCQVKRCGDPGTPNNGRKDSNLDSVGSTVRYSCNEGYELVGERDTVCLVSAQWSNKAPSCREIKCPSLNNPANGTIVGKDRTKGSSVTLECNDGYLSAGPSTASCQQNKTWTNQPFRCQGRASCPLYEDISHGHVIYPDHDSVLISRAVQHDVKAIVQCDQGYSRQGVEEVFCLYGAWYPSDKPSCIPDASTDVEKCVVNEPGSYVVSVYRDYNGKNISVGAGGMVRQGTVMLSRCRYFKYYKFTGDSRRVCQHGQWSGIEPACSPVSYRDGESHRYYSPETDVTVTDQGKLRVKQGANLQLKCRSSSRYLIFSSSRGLDDTVEVKTLPDRIWRGVNTYKTTLDIKDIGVRHSGTYFCINLRTKVQTAEFIVSVY